MKLALVAGLITALPIAASAQAPIDNYAKGVALRKAGRAADAIPYLEAAARSQPRDADHWLNLGLAYSETRRFPQAETALAEALRLSPDYLDVQIALARLAYFQGDLGAARDRLSPVLLRAPTNPEARDLRAQLGRAGAAAAPWRLDASVAYASYSAHLPPGRSETVFFSRALKSGGYASLGAEQVRQFGVSDAYYEADVGGPYGHLAIGGSPDGHFRPRWLVRGGAYQKPRALNGAWTAQFSVELSWAGYGVGEVRALQPAITLAKGDRLSLTARWFNTLDERDQYRTGYGLRTEWRAMPRLRLVADWTAAPESTEGRTEAVRAASLGAIYQVTDRFAVRLDAAREARTAYDRDDISFSMTRRF